MKKILALTFFLGLTGCACSRTSKREEVLTHSLKETNRRYDYARNQNERYSRQLHTALAKRKGK